MIYWREIPFVKISLALITGILLNEWGANWNVLIIAALMGICLSLFCLKGDELRIKTVSSFLLLTCISFTGFMLLSLSDSRLNKKHFVNKKLADEAFHGIGFIEYTGITGSGKQKLEVNVSSCRDETNSIVSCKGKLILYVSKESQLKNPSYGDEITFEGKLQGIVKTSNPYSFDFQKYMERKGIFHQMYINEGTLHFTGNKRGNKVLQMADQVRAACLEIISRRVDSPSERGVASALLLGYREWIPDEINQEYSLTGATHVLSVSGLHTGIVAGMLLWMLGGVKSNSLTFRITKCFIAIAGLWSFSIISGLCPSVMRAATMFSFILVARLLLRKKVNIVNVIALSAFILLISNPHILFDIGFQLSYSALMGIICFQKWIFSSVYLPGPGIRVWNLISVSVAAQLGTLPFSLYYFNQFPIYFWLSGLFVVPLAGIIMILGMATLAMDFMPECIAMIPAYLFSFSTWLMNQSVSWTAHLPGAKSEGISISFTQACILLSCIIMLARAIQPWKAMYLKGSLISLAVFFALYIGDDLQKSQQNKLISYEVRKGVLVDYFDGRHCICITDLDTSSIAYKMTVLKNRIVHKIHQCTILHPDDDWTSRNASYKNGMLHILSKTRLGDMNELCLNRNCDVITLQKQQSEEVDLKGRDLIVSIKDVDLEHYLAEK